MAGLPASHFLQRLADLGQAAHGFNTGIFQGGKLLVCSALTTRNDGASVAHTLARRCSDTGNVGNHRLGHVLFDERGRFFFGGTTDFTDHNDGFGFRIFLQQLQNVDEVGARNRVTTDAHTGGLAEAVIGGLLDRFIGQGAGAGYDTNLTFLVDMARHDADLALVRSDQARAVRTNHANAFTINVFFGVQHVDGRDSFSDTNDQLNTGIGGFDDGVFTERSRYVDNRGLCTGLLYCLTHGVEHGHAQVLSAAFTGAYTTNHLGTVGNGLLRVESTLCAGKALTDNLGVFVDQDAHYLPPAALTTCSAASARLVAAMMFRPLSARTLVPSSALLPSRRTTTGTLTPTSLTAPMMPSAIMSQRTIPPKMLTRTACTALSDRMILNASVTRSLVAPPPTSRKLAGWPPASLMMSMVPMARPAPLTIQPMLPSSAT